MSDLTVKSLSGFSIEEIHRSWTEAFSDYPANIQISVDDLTIMFRQNSVVFEASVGLFDGDQLIGLWMNGLRESGGEKLAYDSGTAIIKKYRGQGHSKKLAQASADILKGLGVSQYILEVLKENERAYRLYLNDGFQVTRELDCFNGEEATFSDIPDESYYEVEYGPFDTDIIKQLPLPDYKFSWQNSVNAMISISDLVKQVVARQNGTIVGYGLVSSRGRISQIAVSDEHKGSDLGSMILKRLCTISERQPVMVINIDSEATWTQELFRQHGFTSRFAQYEMTKSL